MDTGAFFGEIVGTSGQLQLTMMPSVQIAKQKIKKPERKAKVLHWMTKIKKKKQEKQKKKRKKERKKKPASQLATLAMDRTNYSKTKSL